MFKRDSYRNLVKAGLFAIPFLMLAGCESAGPAEKAGKAVDQTVQDAKDVVNPPGAAERAGRNVDKALKP
jgi:hypothetical protein